MTISTILGFRGATTTTAPPSIGLGHGPASFHNAQHRGDVWIHSDGWKGGSKKGDSAALSALTLLAFLFFLNILQSCLQDMTYNNQPTVVVASSAARQEVPAMVAVPMQPMPGVPGVPGLPGVPGPMTPMQLAPAPVRVKRHDQPPATATARSEEQARHLQRVQQQSQRPQRPHRPQHGQRDAGWEMVSVVSPRHTSTPRPWAFPDDEAVERGDALGEQRIVSITPAPVGGKRIGNAEDEAMVRVSLSSNSVEGLGEDDTFESLEPAVNKQEEYDLDVTTAATVPTVSTTERIETATVPVAVSSVPFAMVPLSALRPPGHVVTFVPLASTLRGVLNMLTAPLLRMSQGSLAPASALGQGLGQGLREGLRAAICCDLVVCEAHRLGRIGGRIGERVATTVSTVARWVCGEDESGSWRSDVDEDGDGCRHHIERCERRAGRRTAVSTIASILEAYITGNRGKRGNRAP